MARPDISLPPTEVDDFLARCSLLVVGAIGPDGWPTGALARPAGPAAGGDRLPLRLDPEDPLLGLLRADERACCVGDEHARYTEIKGVMLHGRARPGATAGEVELTVERTVSFDFGRSNYGA